MISRILEGKLNEARSKKDTLKARAKSAETSKQISEMMQGINTGSSALAAFDRMEEKVLALEAESEATLMVWPPLPPSISLAIVPSPEVSRKRI